MALFIIKPDAMRRGLHGRILDEIHQCGWKLAALKSCTANRQMVGRHYIEHSGQPYYKTLIDSIAHRGLILVGLVQVDKQYIDQDIKAFKELVGSYVNPQSGTLRHKFAYSELENAIHASDSYASMEREGKIWFENFTFDMCLKSSNSPMKA